ncbi:MAG TPA: guanosine monophosphate reductase [Candidatus Sulfotelmatobacter sp.]|nr:guanosine monophosphate reductase [Candidatus Sulfotelmatobacter sp.]
MSKLFYRALGKKEEWPNVTGINPSSLTYDDVLLVPQNSKIVSRSHVETKIKFGPYYLDKPIISAPMDTISGEEMARELARLGAIGTIPRGEVNKRLEICQRFSKEGVPAVYCIGLKNGFEEAALLKEKGAKIVLVDVAHGGMEQVKNLAQKIKKELKLFVIAGNIVNFDEGIDYKKRGIDIARVGVGPGSLCITRLVAGSGFPQLSAVFDTSSSGIPVIADGGIKKSGDFAKAIAAGALIAMIGGLFAGCDETPGETKEGKKSVRGQASASYMKDNGVESGEFRSAEGISMEVKAKGPVKNVVDELIGGLRSAMTYAGAQNIEEFHKKAVFCSVSEEVLGENIPWLANLE